MPAMTFAATAAAVDLLRRHARVRRRPRPARPRARPRGRRARGSRRARSAVTVVHFAGYPAPVKELRALCDERGLALIEDAAHSPDAHVDGRMLGTLGLAGAFSFFSNKVLAVRRGRAAGHRRRRGRRARALAAQPGHDLGHRGAGTPARPSLRRARARLQLPPRRAARGAAALPPAPAASATCAGGASSPARYRASSQDVAGADRAVHRRRRSTTPRVTCMPVLVEDASRRDGVRRHLRERTACRRRCSIPPCTSSPPTASASARRRCRGREHVARAEITLPLFPDMDEATQDRVVAALAEALA